jgi:hypothetical protein
MHSAQTSKFNVKMSAIQCTPVFSQMTYVNQFLALPNAVYIHSIYLYWMSIRVEGDIAKCIGGRKAGRYAETVETWDFVIRECLVNSNS